jgi:hypothetical protein
VTQRLPLGDPSSCPINYPRLALQV